MASAIESNVIIRWSIGTVLILIGAAEYLIIRPWALFGGMPEMISVNMEIPEWIKYTLPDALWYSSLLCFMTPLRIRCGMKQPIISSLAALSGPGHELLQMAGYVPGTYCPHDMQAYISLFVIYIIICLSTDSKRLKRLFHILHS